MRYDIKSSLKFNRKREVEKSQSKREIYDMSPDIIIRPPDDEVSSANTQPGHFTYRSDLQPLGNQSEKARIIYKGERMRRSRMTLEVSPQLNGLLEETKKRNSISSLDPQRKGSIGKKKRKRTLDEESNSQEGQQSPT